MNQKEKESLLRGLYGAAYYLAYHERGLDIDDDEDKGRLF